MASLFNAVHSHQGNTRSQATALLECFKDTHWKWPIYEAYIQGQQEVKYEARLSEIEGLKPDGLLNNFTVPQLKKLYSQCFGEKPNSSLRKEDIIKQIIKVEGKDHLENCKQELIAKLKDPTIIDKKSMAEEVVRRIDILAHSLHRKQQMLEVATLRPYWEFLTPMDSTTPPECKALHGTIKHYTDPFWQDHFTPCWRPDCGCYVQSHSKRSLEKTIKTNK